MRKPILILSLIFTVMVSSPSNAEGLICKFTGWNCPVIDEKDLVKRGGLYYRKRTDVPFTGKTTGKTQGTFKNGKKDGPYIRYYKNGQLFLKTNYKDGKWDGPWVTYHKNGQLWSKGTLKNDEEEGPWVRFYENGQLWSKGNYKDGKEEGPWVYYWKDGSAWEKYTGTFKNGVKVK